VHLTRRVRGDDDRARHGEARRIVHEVVPAADEFQQHRGRLFGIAYRMLGTVTDAEDVLQDAWLRWQGVDRARVTDPAAFLARTVTNLCLTALTSARARREVYVGPWLPEPVLTADGDLGPLEDAVQRESVSFALLGLLERLSPAERAAYVLREAFAYSAREVAELLGTSEANARQLHARARRHVAGPPSREVDRARWQELIGRFLRAARDGDVAGLEALLAADVVSRADGGGIVNAARRPVRGRENVARYVAGLVSRFGQAAVPAFADVNGEPAVVLTEGGSLRGVLVVRTDGAVLTALDLVVNPEKLAFAERQLSRNAGLSGPSREGREITP
jgi:RNA polymerase sigma-70 factor (TIGR02957 family)